MNQITIFSSNWSTVICFLLLGLTSQIAAADNKADETSAVCKLLHSKHPGKLAWDPLGPNSLETIGNVTLYDITNTDYWNVGNSRNRPACIFFPSNARDVSYAVKALRKHENVSYALKSGGHNANFGFSSVLNGVLISFRPNMVKTRIASDKKTAVVEPGARWDEALTILDNYGKCIVGGRLGHVGVGGYVLGGGLSFLTAQYGFASDNVVNYELVLADGSIVNANEKESKDLYYALKGGGNQFGIVTKFTMKTHDIGSIWGGTKIYSGAHHKDLISATTNFTREFSDPKAAVIVTFDYTLADLVDLIVMFYFYDGPTPPKGVFDEFDAIPAIESNVKTQSYPELLKANNVFSLKGQRYQIREGTYPNLPYSNMTDFLEYHYDHVKNYAFKDALNFPTSLDIKIFSFAIQPIPVAISRATLKAGGNRLGLHPDHGDRIFMEYDISWLSPLCDDLCPGYIQKVQTDIARYQKKIFKGLKPTNYRKGDVEFISHNPVFMNDGMYDQKVLQSYGTKTYNKLKQIQKTHDPEGFFSVRQDGFKFSD